MEPMKASDQLPEAPFRALRQPRALLVVADAAERARLVGLLGQEWRIECPAAAELAAAARRNPPDILLARVAGEAAHGAAFMRRLRGDPATRTLPVVLLAGAGDPAACLAGVEAGADDFLIEPFSEGELLTRLRRLRRPLRETGETTAGEQRLQSFIDHAPVAVAMFDRDMRYIAASRRWIEDYAATGPIILGGCHYDLFPGQPEHWRDAHRRALAGEIMTAEEDRFDQPDGKTRWFRWEVQPWRGADGAIGGVVVFYEEITERKQAEARLRESEERLKLGADVAGLGLVEIDYPEDVCRLSAEAARLFGVGDEPMTAARPDLHALVHPDDRAEVMRRIAEALDPAGPGWFEMDLRIVQPGNGGVRWLRIRQRVRFGGEGAARRPVGALMAALDVTAECSALEAARRSEEFAREVLDALPQHVAVLDASGKIVAVNEPWRRFARESGGAEKHVSLGANYLDVCGAAAADGDSEAQEMLQALKDVVRGARSAYEAEYPCHPPGGLRWFLMQAKRFARGGLVVSHSDVTQRKLAEEALREADRRKDEFLATLAHELRNPLAPIRNAVHVLGKSIDKNSEVGSLHAMMERQVTHLVRLVDDLMEVSRVTRGKIELRRARIDLSAAVAQALEICEAAIKAGGHQLTVTQAQEPLTLDADMVRLAQVFANLLNNAAKYTPSGGRIALSTRREGDEAVVTVRDTGVGIPADMLPRVFDMFTQVEGEARRAQGGLGIGLALVRTLVELHGGRVEARSEGPGKGSVFIVRLPLALDRGADRTEAAQGRPAPLRAQRLLVVDDNRDVADSLSVLLRCLGAQAQVAYDGDSALEIYDAFHPSAVLLDLGMPGMSGFEIAKRLRARAGDAVTLIAVTGWGQQDDRRRSREAGFDAHLVKPIDPETLQSLLTRGGAGAAI